MGGGHQEEDSQIHQIWNIFAHFWICSTSSNTFYSLFMGACRCQEKDQCIRQISNIFTFNTLWNINIMSKNGISIRYWIFHIFKLAGQLIYPTDINNFYFLWKSSELENQRLPRLQFSTGIVQIEVHAYILLDVNSSLIWTTTSYNKWMQTKRL